MYGCIYIVYIYKFIVVLRDIYPSSIRDLCIATPSGEFRKQSMAVTIDRQTLYAKTACGDGMVLEHS